MLFPYVFYFVKVLDPSRKKPATAEKPSLSASFLNQKRLVHKSGPGFCYPDGGYPAEIQPMKRMFSVWDRFSQ